MNKTKETWYLHEHGHRTGPLGNTHGYHISNSPEDGEDDPAEGHRIIVWEQITEEDGRRIVACRNACEGISTEYLETYGLPDFAAKISVLVEQRADLLAALQTARACIQTDRTCLADCHMSPVTNELDEDGLIGVAEYDAVLTAIDAASAKAKEAL